MHEWHDFYGFSIDLHQLQRRKLRQHDRPNGMFAMSAWLSVCFGGLDAAALHEWHDFYGFSIDLHQLQRRKLHQLYGPNSVLVVSAWLQV